MAVITKLKDFNRGLVEQEMATASIVMRVSFAGFDVVSRRAVSPASAVKTITANHGVPTDTAQPGEIRFSDESQRTAFSSLLDSHVATGTSTSQVDEDLDADALQELKTMFAGTINRDRAVDLLVRLAARETF